MPLLHVRPDRLVRDGYEGQRGGSCAERRGIDVRIARNVGDGRRLGERVVLFQGTGIGLALIGVFEKDAIPAADGPLSVTLGIKGKAEAWRWVEKMTFHAAGLNSRRDSAVHPSVELGIGYGPFHKVGGVGEARAGNVVSGIEIPGVVVDLAISAEHTYAQAQVQRQARRGMPVVLEVGLKDLVPVVGLDRRFLLLILLHISQQQIGKCVPAADHAVAGGVGQNAVGTDPRLRNLVLLRRHKVTAELQVMLADDLGDIVFVGIGRVGIQRAVGYVSRVLVDAIEYAAVQADPRHFAAEAIVEHTHSHSLWTLPIWTHEIENDVVGSVAGYKFIQQRWGGRRREAGDQAHARPHEVRLDRWKAGSVRPQGGGIDLRPGIVDITERRANFVREVVI